MSADEYLARRRDEHEEAIDELAKKIYELVMPLVRGVMWEQRVGYDNADRIAEGVFAGCRAYAEHDLKPEKH